MGESILFILLGVLYGFIFNNIFLSIVMAVFAFLLQEQIHIIRDYKYKKKLNENLRLSIGIITGSYIQNDDIIKAVNDNIDRIPGQVKEVFQDFLVETNFINPDVETAILKMEKSFKNKFFKEWCNCVLQCQQDRELKYILLTISEKMLDVKKVQEELDSMLFMVYRDFFSVVLVALASLPFMYFLNRQWYYILSQNILGQVITAVVYLVTGLSCIYAVKINKPVIME